MAIFTGSQVNDKHTRPSISMDPERLICQGVTIMHMRISMTVVKGQNQFDLSVQKTPEKVYQIAPIFFHSDDKKKKKEEKKERGCHTHKNV